MSILDEMEQINQLLDSIRKIDARAEKIFESLPEMKEMIFTMGANALLHVLYKEGYLDDWDCDEIVTNFSADYDPMKDVFVLGRYGYGGVVFGI